jgi:hypothetical protein
MPDGVSIFDAIHSSLQSNDADRADAALAALEAEVASGVRLSLEWSQLYFVAVRSAIGADAIRRLARMGADVDARTHDIGWLALPGEILHRHPTDRSSQRHGGHRMTALHHLLVDYFVYVGIGPDARPTGEAVPQNRLIAPELWLANLDALLAAGADPNAQPISSYKPDGGPTPLMMIAGFRSPHALAAAKRLIAAGADPRARALESQGRTGSGLFSFIPHGMDATSMALDFDNTAMLDLLHSAGARDVFPHELRAARAESAASVSAALAAGADPRFILLRASVDTPAVIETLVDGGISPDAFGMNEVGTEKRFLHLQTLRSAGHSVLVARGADVEARDPFGDPLLVRAVTPPGYHSPPSGYNGVRCDFQRYNPLPRASLDATDSPFFNPNEFPTDTWQRVLALGANVDARGANDDTALIRVLYRGMADDVTAVRGLLAAGADPRAANRNGITPVALALRYGRSASLTALLEHVAIEEPVSPFGLPLWAAALDVVLTHDARVPAKYRAMLDAIVARRTSAVDTSEPAVQAIVERARQNAALAPIVDALTRP